jgi:3-hydroxyacyl-CoA dehydrogenase
MGFHFMNPVPVMQLVELIRGIATDEPTFNACKAVVDRWARPPPRPRISRPSSSTAS